jgi:dTDP-4-dehydrorhamnose reductase
MLAVGKTRDRLTVVADQHGCPTAAVDLADVILAIITRMDQTRWDPSYDAIFHTAGAGATHVARPRLCYVRGSRSIRREGSGG